MDIYEFINSKDIRKYLKEINHKFKPLESAYIVWQSRRRTLKEKHEAYREIIKTMPNVKFYMRYYDYLQIELSDFLTKYIEIENELMKTFDTDKTAVFSYAEGYGYNLELYPCKEMCIAAIMHHEGFHNVEKFKLICIPLINRIDEKASFITQYVNSKSECVFILEDSFLKGEKCKIFNTFKLFRFNVPLPFKSGDRVAELYSREHAFSFDPQYARFSEDNMSMWCYLPEQEGDAYVDNYLNLEYSDEEPNEIICNSYDPDDVPF